MNVYRLLLTTVVAIVLTTQAQADVMSAGYHLNKPAIVGEARMKVMLWDVFDARLYADQGQFDDEKPFALSLSYLRDLKGEKIVEKTISEMKKQNSEIESSLSQWQDQLSQIIPDVDKRTTITGIRDEHGHTIFYRNGAQIGRIEDRDFTRNFFNIWLGENTSDPTFRKKLLGEINT